MLIPKQFLSDLRENPVLVGTKKLVSPLSLQINLNNGDVMAMLGAALFFLQAEQKKQHVLFLLPTHKEALVFWEAMHAWLGSEPLIFLPQTQHHEQERKENLYAGFEHVKKRSVCWISYPEALLDPVPSAAFFQKNSQILEIDQILSTEDLLGQWRKDGWEEVDFVSETGQFSVRGGIIDAFSFGQAYPYRIELSGRKITSIRRFDPISQLSIKSVEKASFTLPRTQKESETCSFLDLLSKDILLVQKRQEEKKPPDPSPTSLENHLKSYARLVWGDQKSWSSSESLKYPTAPQPVFKKNFELIAQDMYKWQESGYELFLASKSEEQICRLEDILHRALPELSFKPLSLSLRKGFVDKVSKRLIYTDHQLLDRFFASPPRRRSVSGKGALSLRSLSDLKTGDLVVHTDHGVGIFGGLHSIEQDGKKQETIRLIYKGGSLLYVGIASLYKVTRYRAAREGESPPLSILGGKAWKNKKRKAKKKMKGMLEELMRLYAQRKTISGYNFPKDSFLQTQLAASFPHQETQDQIRAIADIKADMESSVPMDRLLCGDVGFGKTEVMLRAAFKAVCHGKQVAILVPTTILALQHYQTFQNRLLENFKTRISYINRLRTQKESRDIQQKIKTGEIDILIGTHKIIHTDFTFKDLGLLIIDEEQKFGVKVKESLREKKLNVDTLSLTATPIPRTMHFSLSGIRDLSLLSTPPPNRQAVLTRLHVFDKEVIRKAILFEKRRQGQCYFVHQRIQNIQEIAESLTEWVPEARVGIAHGRMPGRSLERVMQGFIEGEYDVLLSTNIIENGLDIPNANTILIHQAHLFGLSEIHQMRGRIGRSSRRAFCYLFCPPPSALSSEAKERLHVIEGFSELGDGIKIAMKDLEIRGTGSLLGEEQSGFMNDMGFETYHQLIDQAAKELKNTSFKESFPSEKLSPSLKEPLRCAVETDLDAYLPTDYVNSSSERMRIYTQIARLSSKEDMDKLKGVLQDRFGPLPPPTEGLWQASSIRWAATGSGFERIVWKDGSLKCFFSQEDTRSLSSDSFEQIMVFLHKHSDISRIMERNKNTYLYLSPVNSFEEVLKYLRDLGGKS
ncbi:MAG: transcription-repair coupling factor [Cytophagales bacterium]|nr:transcription-repair coupling factor [Cytophagales bacterium]